MPTFTIDAAQGADGSPIMFQISAKVESVEAAREIAAQFPKVIRFHAGTLYTMEGDEKGYVTTRRRLSADGVNGGVNEAAIKAYKSFIKNAEKLGHSFEYQVIYANSYATREDFEAAIGLK